MENVGKHSEDRNGDFVQGNTEVFGSVMPDTEKKVSWDALTGILMKAPWSKFL